MSDFHYLVGSDSVELGIQDGTLTLRQGGASGFTSSLYTPQVWTPEDHGLIAWTYDPSVISNNTALVNGTVYLSGLILRKNVRASAVWFMNSSAAVTPTAGENFFGLYDSTGKLLSSGGADSTLLTTGPVSVLLDSAVDLVPGLYWAACITNAATPAHLGRNTGAPGYGNLNRSTAAYRYAVNGTGDTSLPATISPSANTQTGAQDFWAAIS